METLNSQNKEELKKRLLNKIENIEQKELKLSSVVRNLSNEFMVDSVTKARIKESLLTKIETVPVRGAFWQKFLAFNKKFVSAMVLFVMTFSFVTVLSTEVRVVSAESFTTLQNFEGDVMIMRNGMLMNVEMGMQLMENDIVSTGVDGFLSIEYFDNSVTRLASNTEIILNRLDEENEVSSKVEVVVTDGQMWSKVVNLVDDSYFSVKTDNVSAQSRRAAFNVEVDQDETAVQVFSHAVKLNDGTEVKSGNKAVFADDSLKLEQISDDDKEISWIKDNIQSDTDYVASVEEKIEKHKRDVVKNSGFQNTITEDALLLITFDDVKQSKLELDLLEKKMIAAEVTLSSDEASEDDIAAAKKVVSNFSTEVQQFYAMIDEIEMSDDEYAAELKQFVDGKLAKRQKDLKLVEPGEALYEVRIAIDALALEGIEDEVERIRLEYEKAQDKLLDAEEKIAVGEQEKADQILTEYEKEIAAINEKLESLSEEEKSEVNIVVQEETVDEEVIVEETTASTAAPVAPVKSQEFVGSYGVKVIDDKPLPAGL